MEFLIHGALALPADIDPAAIDELKAKEAALGSELFRDGILKRQWRVPGRRETWGLWEAVDATALQALLEKLPLYPFFDITVHPLAYHPRDPEYVAPAQAGR